MNGHWGNYYQKEHVLPILAELCILSFKSAKKVLRLCHTMLQLGIKGEKDVK